MAIRYSPGLTTQSPSSVIYAKSRRIPLVVEFRDITFEQLKATGTSETNWKVLLLRHVELMLAKSAKRIIVLTSGFKRILVENGIPAAKITVIPNGAELVEIEDKLDGLSLNTSYSDRQRLGAMLLLARASVMSALARKESRGAHQRVDFPETDDSRYRRSTIVTSDGGRNLRVDI